MESRGVREVRDGVVLAELVLEGLWAGVGTSHRGRSWPSGERSLAWERRVVGWFAGTAKRWAIGE